MYMMMSNRTTQLIEVVICMPEIRNVDSRLLANEDAIMRRAKFEPTHEEISHSLVFEMVLLHKNYDRMTVV